MPEVPLHGIGGARRQLGLRSLMASLRQAPRHNMEFVALSPGRLIRRVFSPHVQVSGVVFHFGIFGHRCGQLLFWTRTRLASRTMSRVEQRKHALVGGAPAAAPAIMPGATVALAVVLLLVARLRVRTDDSLAMEMPLLPGTLWRPVSLRLLVVLTCE